MENKLSYAFLARLLQRYQIITLNESHNSEVLELMINSTLHLSPIFNTLEISRKTLEKSFTSMLEDRENRNLSFVIFDKQKNKIAGVTMITDITNISKEIRPSGCSKKDFKDKIDLQLIQGQLEKNYIKGEYAIVNANNILPEYQGSGIVLLQVTEFISRIYMAGYKHIVNIVYNQASQHVGRKYYGGQILNQINLKEFQFESQYIFKNVKGVDIGCLWYTDLRNQQELSSYLGVKEFIIEKQQQLKKTQENRAKNSEIQPKL